MKIEGATVVFDRKSGRPSAVYKDNEAIWMEPEFEYVNPKFVPTLDFVEEEPLLSTFFKKIIKKI